MSCGDPSSLLPGAESETHDDRVDGDSAELSARLAHPTVRLSGSIDEATAASFLSQVLPVLEVPRSIVVELFSSAEPWKWHDD